MLLHPMSYPPSILAELTSIGILVGVIGTLVGVGGGFVVVPVLVLGFGIPPAMAAGTSLVMVTVNALAGTVAYARQGRLDWRGGLFLSAISYPGSLLGAWLGTRLPAREFSLLFGLIATSLAIWMAYSALRRPRGKASTEVAVTTEPDPAPDHRPLWRLHSRVTDQFGNAHEVSFPIPLASGLCFAIGFIGGMLGVGGGPLLVPAMIYALGYPVHIATASSQLVIALTSAGAALIHLSAGEVLIRRATALSLGALVGAPIGAALSRRVKSHQLVLALSTILLVVGVRLVVSGLPHHLPHHLLRH